MFSFFKKKSPEEEKADQIVEFRIEKEATEKQIIAAKENLEFLERKLGFINKFLEENDKQYSV